MCGVKQSKTGAEIGTIEMIDLPLLVHLHLPYLWHNRGSRQASLHVIYRLRGIRSSAGH